MDRVISLLAALVALIALGGSILVHVNGDAQRGELEAQIASLRTSVGAGAVVSSSSSPASSTAPVPETIPAGAMVSAAAAASDDSAAQISALEARVAELEALNASQASALTDAQQRLAAALEPGMTGVADASALSPVPSSAAAPSSEAASSAALSAPAALTPAAGPTTDCIPLGTRFMGQAGDSFPICKTKVVVKVVAVNDGTAIIDGAGPVGAGSFGTLPTAGCSVMVFSADTSGYAEMRVTCQ